MCFSSDFFIEEADEWRKEVLGYIKERSDCNFLCRTKSPARIKECIPDLSSEQDGSVFPDEGVPSRPRQYPHLFRVHWCLSPVHRCPDPDNLRPAAPASIHHAFFLSGHLVT